MWWKMDEELWVSVWSINVLPWGTSAPKAVCLCVGVCVHVSVLGRSILKNKYLASHFRQWQGNILRRLKTSAPLDRIQTQRQRDKFRPDDLSGSFQPHNTATHTYGQIHCLSHLCQKNESMTASDKRTCGKICVFGGQLFVGSRGWHIINSCVQVNIYMMKYKCEETFTHHS